MNMYEAESIDIDLVEQDRIRDANKLKRYRKALEKIAKLDSPDDYSAYAQLIQAKSIAHQELK